MPIKFSSMYITIKHTFKIIAYSPVVFYDILSTKNITAATH